MGGVGKASWLVTRHKRALPSPRFLAHPASLSQPPFQSGTSLCRPHPLPAACSLKPSSSSTEHLDQPTTRFSSSSSRLPQRLGALRLSGLHPPPLLLHLPPSYPQPPLQSPSPTPVVVLRVRVLAVRPSSLTKLHCLPPSQMRTHEWQQQEGERGGVAGGRRSNMDKAPGRPTERAGMCCGLAVLCCASHRPLHEHAAPQRRLHPLPVPLAERHHLGQAHGACSFGWGVRGGEVHGELVRVRASATPAAKPCMRTSKARAGRRSRRGGSWRLAAPPQSPPLLLPPPPFLLPPPALDAAVACPAAAGVATCPAAAAAEAEAAQLHHCCPRCAWRGGPRAATAPSACPERVTRRAQQPPPQTARCARHCGAAWAGKGGCWQHQLLLLLGGAEEGLDRDCWPLPRSPSCSRCCCPGVAAAAPAASLLVEG